jgi:putative restriction endonuclease
MVKLVLMHKADSIYEDELDVVYDFPRAYLRAIEEAVGDWIVYTNRSKPARADTSPWRRSRKVIPKPNAEGRYLALIEPGSYLPFDREVPRLRDGKPLETALADEAGAPLRGGAVQLAVRRLPERDFARIIDLGLPPNLEEIEANRYGTRDQSLKEEALVFQRPVLERLTRRKYRDVAFSRRVREAMAIAARCRGCNCATAAGDPRSRRPISDRSRWMAATRSATDWPCRERCTGCSTAA